MANFAATIGQQASLHVPALAQLRSTWNAYRAQRRQRDRIIRELNAYSDRELADLGFVRADIWDIANGTYRR